MFGNENDNFKVGLLFNFSFQMIVLFKKSFLTYKNTVPALSDGHAYQKRVVFGNLFDLTYMSVDVWKFKYAYFAMALCE